VIFSSLCCADLSTSVYLPEWSPQSDDEREAFPVVSRLCDYLVRQQVGHQQLLRCLTSVCTYMYRYLLSLVLTSLEVKIAFFVFFVSARSCTHAYIINITKTGSSSFSATDRMVHTGSPYDMIMIAWRLVFPGANKPIVTWRGWIDY
jgi:hypothetical protein